MKKYLVICKNQEIANVLNDLIAVNSLFTEGKSYTDDERVYNAVCAYVQEGSEGVKVYNLRDFEFVRDNIGLAPKVYRINIGEDHITVNGYRMKIKYKSGYTYELLKTYIGTSDPEELALFLQGEFWQCSGQPEKICKHIIVHGNKCA